MKQLEEEMAILRTGLSMVDTAREWYIKQMQSVTDKQAMIDKVNYNVSFRQFQFVKSFIFIKLY